MGRASKAEIDYWRVQVAGYESSGQTRAAYSATQGIKTHQLDYWRLKIKRQSMLSAPGGNWIPVRIIEEAEATIDLNVGKVRITVKPGFNHELLGAVLRVLTV
jgi:hypothetical protein